MANRQFNKDLMTLEKIPVALFARITFGSTGAPTLDAANSKGVRSISRTSAGLYVLTLQDAYQRVLGFHLTFKNSGAAAAPLWFLKTDASATNAAPALTFQFLAINNSTATDPASGEEVRINIFLRNSTAL